MTPVTDQTDVTGSLSNLRHRSQWMTDSPNDITNKSLSARDMTDITDCPNSLTPILTGNHHDRHKHRPIRPTLGAFNVVQICSAMDCSWSSCHFCTPVYVTSFDRDVRWYNEHHNSSADQYITYTYNISLVPPNITTAQPISTLPTLTIYH